MYKIITHCLVSALTIFLFSNVGHAQLNACEGTLTEADITDCPTRVVIGDGTPGQIQICIDDNNIGGGSCMGSAERIRIYNSNPTYLDWFLPADGNGACITVDLADGYAEICWHCRTAGSTATLSWTTVDGSGNSVCNPCVVDGDCPPGEICDNGSCVVPECFVDTDCPPNYDCVDNACVCMVDCPGGDTCNDAIPIFATDGTCGTYSYTAPAYDSYIGTCLNSPDNMWFTFTAGGYNSDISISGLDGIGFFVSTLSDTGVDPCDINDIDGIACSAAPSGSTSTSGEFFTSPGVTYIVHVSALATGDFSICVNSPEPVPGSGCSIDASICDPTQVAGPFTFDPSSTGGPAAGTDYTGNASCATGSLATAPGQDYGWILLNIVQGGELLLEVNGNQSTSGFIDVIAFNIPDGMDPCVAVQDANNEIACAFEGGVMGSGCAQFGNAHPCGFSIAAPIVNAGDQILVIVHDFNDVHNDYSLSLDETGALTGVFDATITDAPLQMCMEDAPYTLGAVDGGGDWSGTGITSSAGGVFDPDVAGAGVHKVYYDIPGECGDIDSVEIEVFADCGALPVTLLSYKATAAGDKNRILWITESEQNNSYFTVEYSNDTKNWRKVDHISGAGTTSNKQYYNLDHFDFSNDISYYRLKQTDFDGTMEIIGIASVDNRVDKRLVKKINTLGQEVDESFRGIVFEYYKDGTVKKVYQSPK